MEMNGRFDGGEVLERLRPEFYDELDELKGDEQDAAGQAAKKGEAPARTLPVPQRLVKITPTGAPQRHRARADIAQHYQPPLERAWVIVAMAAGAAAIAAAIVIAIMP
jgi:hypothetical protein